MDNIISESHKTGEKHRKVTYLLKEHTETGGVLKISFVDD